MQINHSETRFPRVREISKANSKKRLRGLFVPLPPKSFHTACVLAGGGGGGPPNSRDWVKGKCDSLSQNMREEGEGGEETPRVQNLKERLETPSPII